VIEQDAAEAAAAPERAAPVCGITEDNFAPYIPLKIGDQHTAFEWMMLAADLDPNAPLISIVGDTIEHMRSRETRMSALAGEPWRALKRGVRSKRLEPLFWDYCRTLAGDDLPDLTTSVFDAETMAAFFTRVGGYGEKIAAWLAEREQQEAAIIPTGMPGRRGKGKHLIEDEFIRREADRADRGEDKLLNLADEAKSLREWLIANYPKAERPTVKTIRNNIRPLARNLALRRSARN
jgi:hypothetical protein